MCYQEHGEGVDTFLSVGSRTGSVTVHQEERRIQISLYVVIANETSPAGKFLPDVIICHMVVIHGNMDFFCAEKSKIHKICHIKDNK